MPEIKGSAVYVEDGTKKTKLYDEKKHSCGDPMWKWVTKYIYMVLPLGTVWVMSWFFLLLSTIVLLYLYLDCRSSCSAVANVGTPPPASSAKVEEVAPQNQTTNIEQLNLNPASMPPPSPEAEVIERERRIYQGSISPRQ